MTSTCSGTSGTSRNACYTWDFTAPVSVGFEEIRSYLKRECKRWVFQKEKGELNGYEHYQGRCSMKTKVRNMRGKIAPQVSWRVTSTKIAIDEDTRYCDKLETRLDGPWRDSDCNNRYVPLHVRDIKLYPWQERIINDVLPDTRTINILYDEKGNIGKSTVFTYAGARGIARAVPIMESYKDLMRMVMCCPKTKLYLVDFPRGLNKSHCANFWSAIETIKNGYAYDDRYKFQEEFFDPPNIWVFTNTLPDFELLSKDRWKVWTVSNGLDLKRRSPSAPCNTISFKSLEHLAPVNDDVLLPDIILD